MWFPPFKSLSIFLFILILISVTHGIAQAPTVRFVDGEGETLAEVEFKLHQEIVYLPVETLKTAFDPEMTHEYHRPRKQLILKTKGKELRLRMGNTTVNIDSGKQTFTLPAPPLAIEGQPMLPIHFFRKILAHLDDVEVLYNPNLQRIRIMPKTAWALDVSDDTREWTIIIDPGHGGEGDLGCKSQNGLHEKDIVLAAAKEIKKLSEQHQLSIHLTRDQDTEKTLIQRVQTANREQGRLFLSLHCNASFSPNHKGMRLYINNPNGQPRFRTSEMPRFGKKRLNILNQANYLKQSKNFANVLQKELNFLAENPIVITEFPIITLSDVSMPAVLLELGYLSNIDDAKQLSNPDHISELAVAIIRAIQIYSASVNQPSKSNGFSERKPSDTN
ncbi:MAG: N-acetylmuramoyl-L-alanine amidase [Candidatus Poribacteria bacterium]|nr:N-acetylmuramoyl-L-alanine amidase [Candidatus Poribacteria bacterium]